MLIRVRRLAQRRYWWLTALINLAWLHYCIEPDQAYAQVLEQHRLADQHDEQIAARLGLDPDYVKDPVAWRKAQDQKTQQARTLEQAAAAVAAQHEREEKKQKGWEGLPEHERTKALIKDRYRSYLLASADRELAAMAADAAPAPDTKARARRTRENRLRAGAALDAYRVAVASFDERAKRYDEIGRGGEAKRMRAHAEKVRGEYQPLMDELTRVHDEAPADAAATLDAVRPLLARHVADVQQRYAKKERPAPKTFDAPKLERPIDVLELDAAGKPIVKRGALDQGEAPAATQTASRGTGFAMGTAMGLASMLVTLETPSWLAGMVTAVLPPKPGAPTEEAITADVAAYADQFGPDADPVRIYNTIRKDFEYQPYWGQLKGAHGALVEKAGNDLDLSQLLVAVLRHHGIPAEYVWGTVELSSDQLVSLTGIDNAQKACDYLGTAGIPVRRLGSGATSRAWVEHVWVVAGLDYEFVRGVKRAGGNQDTWIPMDVSFKDHDWQPGIDLLNVHFDGPQYLQDMDPTKPEHPLDAFRRQLRTEIAARQITCTSLEQVTRDGHVAQHDFPYVPSSLEHHRLAPGTTLGPFVVRDETRWNGTTVPMPAALAHEIVLRFPEIGLTSPARRMADLYGKLITVRFERIDPGPPPPGWDPAVGPLSIPNGPVQRLTPVVRVDDDVWVRGEDPDLEEVDGGADVSLEVQYHIPSPIADDYVTHQITAGACGILALDYGRGPESEVDRALAGYREALAADTSAPEDELTVLKGLQAVGKRYFRDLTEDMDWSFALKHVRAVRFTAGALIQRRIDAQGWAPAESNIDLARLVVGPMGTDGSPSRNKEALELAGYASSFREHDCWRTTLQEDAISAVRAMAIAANTPGNSIVEMSGSDDPDDFLGDVPDIDKDLMRTALGNGRHVFSVHDSVTLSGWHGAGYILQDPGTGAATYMIGQAAGGDTVDVDLADNIANMLGDEAWLDVSLGLQGLIEQIQHWLAGEPIDQGDNPDPPCSGGMCGDPVNMASGNLFRQASDVAIVSPGIPVSLTRSYNSLDERDGPFGHGWTHSYDGSLSSASGPPALGQAITYREDDGTRHEFPWNGTSHDSPPGKFLTLLPDGSGWKLRKADGGYFEFDASGRLVAQGTDRHPGVEITFAYGPDGLATVTDDAGRTVLTFAYLDGHVASVTDNAGRRWEYGYDAATGDLVDVLDPADAALPDRPKWRYEYASHRLTAAIDPLGHVDRFSYDSLGRVYAHENPLGETEFFFFDPAGRRGVVTDRARVDTVTSFDEMGRPTAAVDPGGNQVTQEWNDQNLLVDRTDPRGVVTTWTFDSVGNRETETVGSELRYERHYEGSSPTEFSRITSETVPSEIDPLGVRRTWLYPTATTSVQVVDPPGTEGPYVERRTVTNARGQLLEERGADDPLPAPPTTYAYEPSDGSLDRITDPVGRVSDYGFDPAGRLSSMVDASGVRLDLGLDPLSRIHLFDASVGSDVSATFDASGRRASLTDSEGTTTFSRDALGRVASQALPNGGVEEFTYDARDQLATRRDARGGLTRILRDELGRRSGVVRPDGTTFGLAYCADFGCSTCSSAGSACRVVGPDGRVVGERQFDDAGRVKRFTDANDHWVEFERDVAGRVTLRRWQQTLDPSSAPVTLETRFTYDQSGNLTSVAEPGDPTPVVTRFVYDHRGNRKQVIDGEGHVWLYDYDDIGRLISEQNPESQTTWHDYDAAGNETILLHPDCTAVRRTFNATGRDDNPATLDYVELLSGTCTLAAARAASPLPHESDYWYDTAARRTRAQNASVTLTYAYTPEGKLSAVTQESPSGHVITSEYDKAGNRTAMTGPNGRTEYFYDAMNRLVRIEDPVTGTFELAYDSYGRRTELRYPNGVVTSYGYDPVGLITSMLVKSAAGDVLQAWVYTYDELGHPLSKVDAEGQSETYRYDRQGRLILADYPGTPVEQFAYDADGNRTQKVDEAQTVTYERDLADRLLGESWDGTPAVQYVNDTRGFRTHMEQGSHVVDYTWDAQGRLLTIADSQKGSFAFGYDPDGLRVRLSDSVDGDRLFLHDGQNVAAEYDAGTLTLVKSYTQGPNVDEPLAQVDYSGATPVVEYLHADRLGTVTLLTSASGAVAGENRVRAFGDELQSSGADSRFGFTGRDRDRSGLVYNRARYDDTSVGGFLSPDPFAGVDDVPVTLNDYIYGADAPTTFSDPDGHFIHLLAFLIFVAVILLIIYVVYTCFTAVQAKIRQEAKRLAATQAARDMELNEDMLYNIGLAAAAPKIFWYCVGVAELPLPDAQSAMAKLIEEAAKNKEEH